MASLFDIDREISACIKLENSDDFVNTETGEIIDVQALDALKMEKEKKLRNIGCWVLNLKAEEQAIVDQIKKFTARKQAIHNKIESLQNYTAAALNGEPWKCTECEYKWRMTESVQFNGDIKAVPVEYLRLKEPELDKAKIKKALKSGVVIAGCTLEKKNSMSIK